MDSTEPVVLASLTHLMAKWASAGTQAAVAAEAGVDIDPVDLPPLYMLGLEGPARSSDLAAALRISRPTATKQLNRLAAAGFVERIPDPSDRRASIVRLTARGAEVHSRLVAQGVVMVTDALIGWSESETKTFAAQLARFVRALGATDSPGAAPDPGVAPDPGAAPDSDREPAAGPSRPAS